ncbi:UDP-phosphate galactose phosphotransferase, partial [bacterium]|nr:UDP-phosphate galactose phosphotransferase [bacterium]
IDESDKYGDSKYQRSIVKPGITGLWQINGRNDLDYKERSYLDIYYIENWSLFLDIKILFKTLGVFFKKNGAY